MRKILRVLVILTLTWIAYIAVSVLNADLMTPVIVDHAKGDTTSFVNNEAAAEARLISTVISDQAKHNTTSFINNKDVAEALQNSNDVEEMNRRWEWNTQKNVVTAKENSNQDFYTEEELLPWIKRPIFDFDYPGKNGAGYTVPNPSQEDALLIKQGYDTYRFNEFVCSKIPLHRTITDGRPDECKVRRWKRPLPQTSIIVTFYNEAWCTLMRTIFSILETTPKILLKEIILVDDASTLEHLKGKLDDFLPSLKIVKLVRLKEKKGIVPARMAGVTKVTAEVITFLDAHCECTKGWLEPLLERIAEDPTVVVNPVVEDMPPDTFSFGFRKTKDIPIYTLRWELTSFWGSQRPRSAQTSNDKPIPTPLMVGGMFSIKTSYFHSLGTFDEGMEDYGAENVEMSFRIWLCNGSMEIHPCSHVGHMHRHGFQYRMNNWNRNSVRVAEVWMDDYKKVFYDKVPSARKLDAGNFSDRIKLRERLHCKPFDWYLDNVHPELYGYANDAKLFYGEWASEDANATLCLDTAGAIDQPLVLWECHGINEKQKFSLTIRREFRNGRNCLQPRDSAVILRQCASDGTPDQRWFFDKKRQKPRTLDNGVKIAGETGNIRHSSGKCLETVSNTVQLLPCDDSKSQLWRYRDMSSERIPAAGT